MAFVVRVEEQHDGKVVRGVELWRADASVGVNPCEGLGLRLAESRAILARLQHELVGWQVDQLCLQNALCERCGARLHIKDYRSRRLDTPFGRLTLRIPRKACPSCKTKPTIDAVLSSRTPPELVLMQAKLAAHLPYRVAGRLLADLLPLEAGISHTGAWIAA